MMIGQEVTLDTVAGAGTPVHLLHRRAEPVAPGVVHRIVLLLPRDPVWRDHSESPVGGTGCAEALTA
jgi:hypothetical protein